MRQEAELSHKKRILVFGQSGQVGGYLSRFIRKSNQFTLLDSPQQPDGARFDLGNTDQIASLVLAAKPDWVVNTAAYTAVDQAEDDQDQCYKINCEAPREMAIAARSIGAGFVHYSTDYVFDGDSAHPYCESDKTNPRSVYGKSKLAGENAVLDAMPEALILRTAWVYAKTGKNFVNTMLRLAQTHSSLRVVDDQIGCPTFASDLAEVTFSIIKRIECNEIVHQGGIYHATGRGEVSWYEFCREIMALSGFSEIKIDPIPSEAFPTPAPRPKYSVLDNSKLLSVYDLALPEWQSALSTMLTGEL